MLSIDTFLLHKKSWVQSPVLQKLFKNILKHEIHIILFVKYFNFFIRKTNMTDMLTLNRRLSKF